MSAFAATLISAAVILAPRPCPIDDRDFGPRLFAIEAGVPTLASRFATACPMFPAPMIPIVMLGPHLLSTSSTCAAWPQPQHLHNCGCDAHSRSTAPSAVWCEC